MCITFDINIRYSCRSILSFFSDLSIKFSGRNRNYACAMPVGFSDHQARGGGGGVTTRSKRNSCVLRLIMPANRLRVKF